MSLVLNHLKQLAETLNEEVVIELLFLFEKQLNECLPKLKTYVEKKNYYEASQLAHMMKSSALNVGAFEISGLFHGIEKNTKTQLKNETIETIIAEYQIFRKITASWTVR